MVFCTLLMRGTRSSKCTTRRSVWMLYKLRQSVKPMRTSELDVLVALEAGRWFLWRQVNRADHGPVSAIGCTRRWRIGTRCLRTTFPRSSGRTWQTLSYYSNRLASRICSNLTSWTLHLRYVTLHDVRKCDSSFV